MGKQNYRIGQIVPSSNVTMETEIPALLRAREQILPERFTFHSARMRMKKVTKEELEAMDAESDRCALELSDAAVDVMGYACLVAIMSMGPGYHRESERRLEKAATDNGHPCPVVSSAGALVEGLKALGAKRVSVLAPYMKSLTRLVTDYIENEGFEIVDVISLEIPDNLEVAAQDPLQPSKICARLNVNAADAVIASACVQMPSLPSIEPLERTLGLPTVSAAVCTTYLMLNRLGLETRAPGGGTLLSGRFGRAKAA